MLHTPNSVFRDFVTDGVPSSGTWSPKKSEIRALLDYYGSLANLAFTNGKVYATKAALDADLVPAANTPALVSGDGANDGLYMKVGATGVGSWTRLLDFVPGTQIMHAVDAGAGTPNAIVATSSIGLSTSGSQVVRLDVFETNTASPVTVAFNGGSALTIKTAAGNNVVAGGLTAGPVLGTVSGSTFRLLSDQASAAVLSGAETAAATSVSSAAAALAAANAGFVFDTVADLQAATIPLILDFVRTAGYAAVDDGGGAQYTEIPLITADQPWHKLTNGGTRRWELVFEAGRVNIKQFGAKGDGVTDDLAAGQAAIDYVFAKGGGIVLVPYTDDYYRTTAAWRLKDNVALIGDGSRPKIKKEGAGLTRDTGAVVLNDGYYTASGNENVHVRGLTLQNRYQDFLVPVADSGETIGSMYGIFFAGVTGGSITECHVLDTCAEGIYIGGVDGARDLCSDILVHGNQVENCFASGIAVTHGTRIRITDNLLKNTAIFGIDVEPNTNCVGRDIVISGNVIDGVQATYYKNSTGYGQSNALGISINQGSLPDQVSDVTVVGNTVRNVQRYTAAGINDFASISAAGVFNCTISGNVISESQSGGIILRGNCRSISVNGNGISNVEYTGVYVSASVDIAVAGNTIKGVALSRGISILGASAHVAVTGNIVVDSHTAGILVQSATQVAVTGNSVRDSRSGGARLMTYGIHIGGSVSDAVATGNIIKNTVSDPLRNVDSPTNFLNGGNSEEGTWRIRSDNFHLFHDGGIYKALFMTLTARAASGIANVTLFVDSADNRLKFKDSSANTHVLIPLEATATVDPASLAPGQRTATATIAVTGAALGDIVKASFSLNLAPVRLVAWVSANGTVSYYFENPAALLAGSATYDAASIAAGAEVTTTVTVTGAAVGDAVVGMSHGVDQAGLTIDGYVSAANTVTAVVRNGTAGAIDLASATLRAVVLPVAATDIGSGTLKIRVEK
ncbi:MAG: hypothetical protein E5Y03_25045 [Mesorhizobium sp.]|uniref:right-handed parallel beta-helix repeat-containing protein n=1 Tax=Mesorhizobium sp. TaxID=1871066 RepID=UPI001218714F|nr:right-handed parallel beta-helix repeat-containing protein [Mesorhizobium sp.]TIN98298.1 MAG: hypothetical protein E5Y03_25045 [Mesorhizobium sp.]